MAPAGKTLHLLFARDASVECGQKNAKLALSLFVFFKSVRVPTVEKAVAYIFRPFKSGRVRSKSGRQIPASDWSSGQRTATPMHPRGPVRA